MDEPDTPSVTLRFYEELNDFLPAHKRKRSYRRPLFLSPTVKDVIEAEGVPHGEVDLILVNGVSVAFDHRLRDGDRVAVYPMFEALDIGPLLRLRPRPLRVPRFILDVHLGKLARRLRMLGFDTLYRNDFDDHEIVEIAARERRIILTRDIGLLKHGAVTHGYWLRSTRPARQIGEVLEHFDLHRLVDPFARCTVCNGEVRSVEKSEILDRLHPGTARTFDVFYQCGDCGKVYWEGAHYEDMCASLSRWLEAPGKGK
ncbi:MAG: Mut7-C RNAse domain-containing protein [Gammaproteobacteria bacterium]|nr:Mut7-C RNAse domain-containing protein [Gammaproteobacteria bacterium]